MSLFDAAAERIALATGKAKSQVAAEIRHPQPVTIEGGLFDVTVDASRKIKGGRLA